MLRAASASSSLLELEARARRRRGSCPSSVVSSWMRRSRSTSRLRVEPRLLRRALGLDQAALPRRCAASAGACRRARPRPRSCRRPGVGVAARAACCHQLASCPRRRAARAGCRSSPLRARRPPRCCSFDERLGHLDREAGSGCRRGPCRASFGGPSPRRRWTVPCWVPAGTRIRFVPLSVGTSTVAPVIASTIVIGTSTSRLSPLRLKIGDVGHARDHVEVAGRPAAAARARPCRPAGRGCRRARPPGCSPGSA